MKRIEIYIPSDTGTRCMVQTENLDGTDVEGAPFKMIDPGESAAVEFEPKTQRIVILEKLPEE